MFYLSIVCILYFKMEMLHQHPPVEACLVRPLLVSWDIGYVANLSCGP
jgi:hypothetical protein